MSVYPNEDDLRNVKRSAVLRGVKTQSFDRDRGIAGTSVNRGQQDDSMRNLQIIGKNVQSLQADTREQELLAELRTITWDAVLLSETWREKKQERWQTEDGHMFCGAGGKKGEKGTAILLHRRWARGFRAFHAVSERCCAMDANIEGRKLRLIAAYMPHCGYDDEDVEGAYLQLSGLVN